MIEYIVNKDKRTIVALIRFDDEYTSFRKSDVIFDCLHDAWKELNHMDGYNKKYWEQYDKMFFPYYFSAKAKCNPNDEWDEEEGKRIARERLVKKIKKYRSDSYKIIADLAKKISDKING